MDNYTPYTYPESGESSPRSRGDIDFENPPPSWEDPSTLPPNYKVKFMVSYNGKIQPRSHDNLLSYMGGETKILSVDRSVKFSTFLTKLNAVVSPDGTDTFPCYAFKYQLPGEDLDALISVTNDDDLEHMMLEFDRMWRGSSKPARLRLFLFAADSDKPRNSGGSAFSSVNSETGKLGRGSDPDITQNGVVADLPEVISPPPLPVHNNVDFLFGLEKVPVHVPGPVPVRVHEPDMVHEMNQLQISGQELHHHQLQYQQQQSEIFPPKNDQNFAEPYKKPSSPANFPLNTQANIPAQSQFPPGYWQQVEQHPNILPQQPLPPPPQLQQHQQYKQPPQQQQQPVYMMHAPPHPSVFHAPIMNAPNQGYYQVPPQQQRMQSDQVYREQPVYNMPAASTAAQVRPESAGYVQVAYDSATGRQVYYAAAPQGVAAPYAGMAAATEVAVIGGGDMRSSGDGKVVHKVV